MKSKIFDLNIEATVLSSVIYYPSMLDSYITKLSSDLFFSPVYSHIMMTIRQLYEQNKAIDEEIIKNKVGEKFETELIDILTKIPISNLDDYIEILKDYKIKRDIQKFTINVVKGLEENISAIELQAKVNDLTSNIIRSNKIDLLEILNINDIKDKEVDFITKGWLPFPLRTVSLVTAPGGTGKSWLVLQLAIRAVQEGIVKKAFLWLSEDPKELSKNRFNKIFERILNIKDESIKNKIDISDSPTIQFLYDDTRKVEVSPLFIHFKVKMQEYDLIILDPLIAFYGTDENNNSSARRFMQLFTDWANKENKTIIFVHHSTKNTTQSRGATAFVDAVRTVYEIDKLKDKEDDIEDSCKRVIKLTKDNYGIGRLLESYNVVRVLFPKNSSQNKIKNFYSESSKNKIPNDF